jgi:hypothetical protein
MQRVNLPLGIKAAALQGVAVAVTFFALLLAPLPEGFFRENGAFAGPLAWLLCALVTVTVLRLPPAVGALAALVGGLTGALVGMASHTLGLVCAVAAVGAVVAVAGARGPLRKGRRGAAAGR